MSTEAAVNARRDGHGDLAEQAPGVLLRGVSKEFPLRHGSLTALRDVSLTVPKNGFCSIIGPSGCGKSTILRILAGLDEPTAGDALIDGDPVVRDRRRQPVGIAFQDAALLPWRTVRDNIRLPLQIAGVKPRPGRVDELVALVGLDGFGDAKPRQLSGGMRQRVSIARALVTEPEVLLLDEPFGALDDLTRRTLNLELLRVLERAPATTLMVTHGIDEALLLSDTVAVMSPRPGRIVELIDVDLPKPRSLELLGSDDFHRLHRRILSLLYEGRQVS